MREATITNNLLIISNLKKILKNKVLGPVNTREAPG